MSVTHPRVVNVRDRDAAWHVYGGRGPCPCLRGRTCSHRPAVELGNPFSLRRWGPVETMRLFLAWLAGELPRPRGGPEVAAYAREHLRGRVVACWCKGRHPVCHVEVYARLADGEDLEAIRSDVMGRLEKPAKAAQGELFCG